MLDHAYILKYGESFLPEDQILAGGDPAVKCPISFCFFLLQADGRNILADVGCDTMPGFEMQHFCSPVQALNALGLSPADVTDVIITHAHHDHIDGLRHFAHARVYIQEEALAKGQKYIPNGTEIAAFSDSCTVTEGIEAVRIGGHAVGSSVVNFTYNGIPYTVVGDECYTPACMARGIPTGVSKDPVRSAAFLRDYEKRRLLYCHDPAILPGQNGALRLF
ncbi:MAG: MBL fold metallo-hydrolase [Clostridia bacterium]|nr:MBL fold metallo-hydrolase [Clostridia bacterium]